MKPNVVKKIFLGFISIIILMTAIAIFGWYSAEKIGYIEKGVIAGYRLEKEILLCRREEKNIMIRGVLPEYIVQWQDSYARIQYLIPEMKSKRYIGSSENSVLEKNLLAYEQFFLLFIKQRPKALNTEILNSYDEQLKKTGRLVLGIGEQIIQQSKTRERKIARITFSLLIIISVLGIGFSVILGYRIIKTTQQSLKEKEDLAEQLKQNNLELTLGLSEYLEILKRVSQGELEVKAPENLPNILLAKLGKTINQIIAILVDRTKLELEQLYLLSVSGIRVVDKEFNVLRVNPSMEEFCGAGKEEILKSKCYDYFKGSFCHTDDCTLKQILAGKEKVNVEVEKKGLSGRKLICLLSAVPLKNKDGEIIGVIEDFTDITELKQTEELKVYAEQLKQSNANLEDFAHIASHDLQEPLRKVKTFGDLLMVRYNGKIDNQGCDYIQRMQSAAIRMQKLIEDLLSYSRVTKKGQPFMAVDLNIAVNEALSDLEIRIKETNGRVEAGDLPIVNGDFWQISQLFQNLIGNALKFHKKDQPPVVKVYKNDVQSAGDDSSTKQFCAIVVEDNGIGFDKKYTNKIFEIFQRLHGHNEYEGTGVGLAICKKIVERHGGAITVQSHPGEGTKFIVTLPFKS